MPDPVDRLHNLRVFERLMGVPEVLRLVPEGNASLPYPEAEMLRYFNRAWTDHGMLMVAHNSKEAPWDGPKPATYLYQLSSLLAHDAYPAAQKIYKWEVGGSVMQVTRVQ